MDGTIPLRYERALPHPRRYNESTGVSPLSIFMMTLVSAIREGKQGGRLESYGDDGWAINQSFFHPPTDHSTLLSLLGGLLRPGH